MHDGGNKHQCGNYHWLLCKSIENSLANIGQKHKHQSMDRWGRALTSKSSSEYRTLFLWGKGEGERRHHQSQVHIFQHLSKLRLWRTWRIGLMQVQWAYNTPQLTELHFSSGCFLMFGFKLNFSMNIGKGYSPSPTCGSGAASYCITALMLKTFFFLHKTASVMMFLAFEITRKYMSAYTVNSRIYGMFGKWYNISEISQFCKHF